jgi:hypothetical protein
MTLRKAGSTPASVQAIFCSSISRSLSRHVRILLALPQKSFLDSSDHRKQKKTTIHELTRKEVRGFSCILVDRLPILRKVISFNIQNSPRSRTFGAKLILIGSISISLSLFVGCSTAEKPKVEAPPPPATAQADQPAPPVSKSTVAQANEVQDALNRVFKGSVLIDTSRKPSFTVGDFNGDLSQDVAVVLKPAPDKITQLNEEFPAWILRDLSKSAETGGPRLRVTANDALLAVIHGYGPDGWRTHDATQTYLLKNAAGSALATQNAKDFIAANHGRKLPALRGDVIGEEVGGASRFLYYASSTYSFYDPNSVTDEPDRGMIHTMKKPAKK